MHSLGILALIASAMWSTSAAALEPANPAAMSAGYTYYNRSGATLEDHDREVATCIGVAAMVRTPNEILASLYGPAPAVTSPIVGQPTGGPTVTSTVAGVVGGALGQAINSAIDSAKHRGLVGASLENCMVVRGWRVVRVPEPEGAVLAVLPQAELATRLQPWVGAETPHGTIVREWNNDAILGSTIRSGAHPHSNDGLLSLKAVSGKALNQVEIVADTRRAAKQDKEWRKSAVSLDQLASIRPDAAIAILHLKGVSMSGSELIFSRIGASVEDEPSLFDMANVDLMEMVVPPIFAKNEGNFRIFVLKPGRWRLNGMGFGNMGTLNFCLGAPSFEVTPGDVIYLGSFDFKGERMGPDLSMDQVKTFLGSSPAASKVKVPVYTNGSIGRCGDSIPYAIEFPNAAFEPGYSFGSARTALPRPTERPE